MLLLLHHCLFEHYCTSLKQTRRRRAKEQREVKTVDLTEIGTKTYVEGTK